MDNRIKLDNLLLKRIKQKLPALESIWADVSDEWGYEDPIYRFYHGSFKVFQIQALTEEMVEIFHDLYHEIHHEEKDPKKLTLNHEFLEIVKEGTGKHFKLEYNQAWGKHTRPLVEAFFHARYFLAMLLKYGKELEHAPNTLPSGWAAVLHLFNIR